MGRALKHPVASTWLAEALGCAHAGPSVLIERVDAADAAGPASLCFVKNAAWAARAGAAGVVLGTAEELRARTGPALHTATPRLDFARLVAYLEATVGFVWDDTPAQVDPSVRLGNNITLGPGVRIGPGTVIGHNVVIGAEVVIGARCNIKSSCVIGEEGFGFERQADGRALRLPHLGTVRIGDDVEVGSLTTVCRGTLGDTVLEDGAKIDDHVHIAHNVRVGAHAFVIACAEISGGVRIGARAWIAPGASVLNQASIGADATVGLGAVVLRDVADGATVVGNPARPLVPRGQR